MKAKITVNREKVQGEVSPLLFGHFMEHAFGNIYGGVYDPGHPLSDEDGFRTDVLELLKEVKVPILRYPGGNFVSNYHWEDGVGPRMTAQNVLTLPGAFQKATSSALWILSSFAARLGPNR